MATITIYLTYQAPNLMWRNSTSDSWQIMEEKSLTALTTAGDTVQWITDSTISKIKNIEVGKKTKLGSGYHWKDIWSTKPKKDSDTQFSGVVSSDSHRGDADGYDISVQIKNGADVTVDPGVGVKDPP